MIQVIKLFCLVAFITQNALATEKMLKIYHDSDYSSHDQAAISIYQGFTTALAEVNHSIQGYQIKVIKKDHRGNSKRSLRNMQQFLKDPQGLLILGGLHSPPYIQNRQFINKNSILLLVPWAAGSPITRYPDGKNWVFRLSIDDSKAGYRLAQFALDEKACKQPHLLLEETGWGKGNLITLNDAIKTRLGIAPDHTWFTWGTRFHQAKEVVKEIGELDADCIIFVGNAIEGEQFVKAMADLPVESRLPIISHWGITGGNFHEKIPHEIRSKIDLNFIQTCFSFLPEPQNALSNKVLESAKKLFPDAINEPRDIQAPPGFAHGYDIGKILIQALNQINIKGPMDKVRSELRNKLENLDKPIEGLVKTYIQPFTKWQATKPDAHEALGLDDICMGYYQKDNSIRLHSDIVEK